MIAHSALVLDFCGPGRSIDIFYWKSGLDAEGYALHIGWKRAELWMRVRAGGVGWR